MTSPYVRPDSEALASVTRLAAAVGEELGAWRQRALRAEADLQAAGAEPAKGPAAPAEVEVEVMELRRRLAAAREQVDMLRTRLRFLEERNEGAA